MDPDGQISPTASTGPRKRARTASRPSERPAYPRKRAAQACHTCRLRRTKCDNGQPSCTSCVDLGTECVYQEKDKSTFDLASLAILQRLDGLEELIRSGQQPPLVSPRIADEPSPLTGLKAIGSPTLERTDVPISYQITVESILSWPVFAGQSVSRNLDLKQFLQSETSDVNSPSISVTPDVDSNVRIKLFERFLETVHIYNPVLEETKIRESLQSQSFKGYGWEANSCLLLLICALGSMAGPAEGQTLSSATDFRRSQDFKQAEAYFLAAQKRMGLLLCKTGLMEAQCFFLSGVYLMNNFQPIEAWRMFVQALSCCQGSSHDIQNEQDQQLQESIYWTCFKSELEVRLNLNLAKESVWDLTYPSFFPSPPKGLKSQGEVVWYFYLAEIALRRLGNRVLNFVYKLSSSETSNLNMVEAVIDFESQAAGWLKSLPSYLKLDVSGQDEDRQNVALRFILGGHLLDCYEIMYWPFIVDAIHGTLPYDPASQSFVKKGLELCVERIEKNEAGFQNRHHGTWFMLRSCTRSALVLIAAARSGKLDAFLPIKWRQTVCKVIDLLRYWKDETKDTADRLRILEEQMMSLDASLSS